MLGVCTGILLPKEYRSSTVILVQEGKSDNPLFDKLAVSTTVEQRLAGIRESLLGWTSLSELEFEQLIENIRKSIKIQLRGGNVLQLDYVGKDPEKTQAVLKNITDIFISRNQVTKMSLASRIRLMGIPTPSSSVT